MKAELQDMINECTAELNNIEETINNLSSFDKKVRYLSKYALIKASGTIEFVYHSIVADFFLQFSVPQMDTYLENTVRTASSSAKYDNMCSTLKKFDVLWAENFKNSVNARSDAQKIIMASKSLVENRHNFAHGKEPTATFADIKSYYVDILKLIDVFDSVVT